ncbi:peptidylprolyl isomerase [Teredinibacter haidensis]|uniref:peptidylprolyl isomerase n=1 Tax=Teredinibacter haidensis TaxID=2731755 RepID=UPI000948B860|nr:peptidylprolyl isomerase [Teredinibacter haidensis]
MLKINSRSFTPTFTGLFLIAGSMLLQTAQATTVQFQTSLGNFEVILFDEDTPQTVANFLDYVDNGLYTETMIHRSVKNFVIQGGGLTFSNEDGPVYTETNAPVSNEPVYSNLRGTISMAKVACDPNSATNQWFINLTDNSAELDPQNGGYAVFGQVAGDGMQVVDSIAQLPVFNMGSSFSTLPLTGYTLEEYTEYYINANTDNYNPVKKDNIVHVDAIVVTDSTVNTSASLTIEENTLIDSHSATDPSCSNSSSSSSSSDNNSGSSGGGSSTLFGLVLLAVFGRFARKR